jgi:hypothetical protein
VCVTRQVKENTGKKKYTCIKCSVITKIYIEKQRYLISMIFLFVFQSALRYFILIRISKVLCQLITPVRVMQTKVHTWTYLLITYLCTLLLGKKKYTCIKCSVITKIYIEKQRYLISMIYVWFTNHNHIIILQKKHRWKQVTNVN